MAESWMVVFGLQGAAASGTLECQKHPCLGLKQGEQLENRIATKAAEAASGSATCGSKNRSRGAVGVFGVGLGMESGAPAAGGAAIGREAAVGCGASVGRGAIIGREAVIGRGAAVGREAAVGLLSGVGTTSTVVAAVPTTPPMPMPTYAWGDHASILKGPGAMLAEDEPESYKPPSVNILSTPPMSSFRAHIPVDLSSAPVPFSASTSSTPWPTPPQPSRTVKQKPKPPKRPSGPLSTGPSTSPASDDSGDFMLPDFGSLLIGARAQRAPAPVLSVKLVDEVRGGNKFPSAGRQWTWAPGQSATSDSVLARNQSHAISPCSPPADHTPFCPHLNSVSPRTAANGLLQNLLVNSGIHKREAVRVLIMDGGLDVRFEGAAPLEGNQATVDKVLVGYSLKILHEVGGKRSVTGGSSTAGGEVAKCSEDQVLAQTPPPWDGEGVLRGGARGDPYGDACKAPPL
ncbi:hypothetical protein BDK51DRAFT_46121 [Blyttiomyces helicus]|uniref:Uncharacterized protein n=1 Tax=Blyttiomyces helicus TaxID=388810 RepID=A0A4P9W041_9FUNG|nr:hypothetical protein BDK51DRAFT_46121 [Blyttiomyces helicus]|eukprot:RKO83910.1 hypothetical protein BDK51DRAFT_46121 [Blyttiomyces helicus]